MSEHFNIQISVQKVVKETTPARGMAGPSTERDIVKVVELAIVAPTEREAFAKARKMLAAAEPEWAEEQHLHRASCDDAGGNLMCGYPADGPTIADRPLPRAANSKPR